MDRQMPGHRGAPMFYQNGKNVGRQPTQEDLLKMKG